MEKKSLRDSKIFKPTHYNSTEREKKMKNTKTIDDFIKVSADLFLIEDEKTEACEIYQHHDKKHISFKRDEIENILRRKDLNNEDFLQLDFYDGTKILLTKNFVGFAPAHCEGLDIDKLPKVVTTLDLLSVIEAIESSVYGQEHYEERLEDVKLFFESIATGAEAIGFTLAGERLWVEKLLSQAPTRFDKSFF